MDAIPNSDIDPQDLPAIIVDCDSVIVAPDSEEEKALIRQSGKLFRDGYFGHSLLDLWNAAVFHLRRRVEAYGIELFESVVKDESGRKSINSSGESIYERWSGVDDAVLISGCSKLGLLSKKGRKALEMINWMRNHASPAHNSDTKVEREDVIALALMLESNLFRSPFPEPGHSVSSLFSPVKSGSIDQPNLELLSDQVRALRTPDIKVAFGFMLDLLCAGEPPSSDNAMKLLPVVWERATDELRKIPGVKFHSHLVKPESDTSADGKANTRILELLVAVKGVKFIPDSARAQIYRKAARNLRTAKNEMYGWESETKAAKAIAQLGPHVPSIAFEEVYQEILSIWCGNYWGRSSAHHYLKEFIEALQTDQIRIVARLFSENERVRDELFQEKPKKQALSVLTTLYQKLQVQSHKNEIDSAIRSINEL